jgi:hypothetical protein
VRRLAVALVVLALAGCVETSDAPEPACEPSGQPGFFHKLPPIDMDPTLGNDFFAVGWGWGPNVTVVPWEGPLRGKTPDAGGQPDERNVHAKGNGAWLLQLAFYANGSWQEDPPAPAWAVRQGEGDCEQLTLDQWRSEAEVVEGERVVRGRGVHVLTAGFLENGSLFYTNMESVEQNNLMPRVDWYEWSGGDPLPVYVYDQDRSEQPPHWKAPSRLAPPNPGTPVLQAAEGEAGVGYFTTIKGFNEALKTMSTTTQRVVRIAPEEAYTLPGYEEHPLYGEALVFVIDVLDVVDAPCPATLPDCPSVP